MEYLGILLGCVLLIILFYWVFEVNMKRIKEVAENKKLDEIVSKFPENKEICKTILKKIGNEKVKMKVFSDAPLSETQMEYLRSLKRDEAMKIGSLYGWKVIDISSWE